MKVDDPSVMEADGSIKIDNQSLSYLTSTDDHNTGPLYELVHGSFFVRNTKESIGLEYDVPEVR